MSTMHETTQPLPKLKPNQVLVSVQAASINPIDYKLNVSLIPFVRWFISFTVGRDIAGVVLERGSNITHFKEGDRVFGCGESGALAQFAVCNENKIALIPDDSILMEDIVGTGLAGCTALQSILWFYNKEDLHSKHVFVIGGSGGVGSQVIQMLKYYNTQLVWGVCSNKNVEYVKSICDKAIDYTQGVALQIAQQKFDLIIDTVTSMEDENQREKYEQFLYDNGKYVQINGSSAEFTLGILDSYVFGAQVVEKKNFHLHVFHYCRRDLQEIAKMVRENKLKVKKEVVKFNEDEVNKAFDKLKSRRMVGKVVFDIKGIA